MKTAGVKRLVELALAGLPLPYGEDVIEDVFCAIEKSPEWRQEYDDLCVELTKSVVNTWGGFWIAHHVGRAGDQQAPSKRCSLIGSFSKLTGPTVKRVGAKIKEAEALQVMAAHYQAHKSELPESVRKNRDLIVDLLMAGLPVEEAFSKVQKSLE